MPERFVVPTPMMVLQLGYSLIPTGLDKRPDYRLLPKNSTGDRTWKPYQVRRPSPDEMRRWERANPWAYAIVTGQVSGIVTFDFDGDYGIELAEAWGVRPHRRTGSNGLHWDVCHPGGYVRTLNGKAYEELGRRWRGLDIKGNGGYAIAFGRSAAGPYVWLRDVQPDPPELVPVEVWEFLRANQQQRPAPEPFQARIARPSQGPVHVAPTILVHMALTKVANGIGRNNEGFFLACHLRDNGYSEFEAEGVLLEYARLCPSTNTKHRPEPYTTAEVKATLRSVFSLAPRRPWRPKSINAR